jgi:hypothetical protein
LIRITELAVMVLIETLHSKQIPPDEGFRLKLTPMGPVMCFGAPNGGDRIMKIGDRPLLIIDRDLEEMISDAVIDIDLLNDVNELVLRRPKDGAIV